MALPKGGYTPPGAFCTVTEQTFTRILGACSLCGGHVEVVTTAWGLPMGDVACASCGAVPKGGEVLTVVAMEKKDA